MATQVSCGVVRLPLTLLALLLFLLGQYDDLTKKCELDTNFNDGDLPNRQC